MNIAKIADLKNNLSRYLDQVRRGGEITVLDRDTPIARLIPFGPRAAAGNRAGRRRDDYWTPERLAAMERQGLIRRGEAAGQDGWLDAHPPVKLPRGSPSAVEVLLKMRRGSLR
jgi:prevent-host-death family protein